MPNIPVENINRYGLISDREPYELPIEAWNVVENVRFTARGAEKFQGHSRQFEAGIFGKPYWLMPWYSSSGFSWIYAYQAVGDTVTRLARIVGQAHSEVTRFTTTLGDDDYFLNAPAQWSGALLGDLPVLTNNLGDVPQQYSFVNGRFENLQFWPAATTAEQIIVVDRFLVALRVTKNGTFDPRMVKWSHPADPGAYPGSWDETDPTQLTGEKTLAETEGELITALRLGNNTLLYKEDSVIAMRFIGGQFIFRFDTIFTDIGALSQHSVVEFRKKHFVITNGDVVVHNGNTWESAIDDINRDLLFDTISADHAWKTQAVHHEQHSEIWVCYADINSGGELNQTLIWNYKYNTWSHRELQDFAYIVSGPVDKTDVSQIFDDQAQIFDSDPNRIDSIPTNPVFKELLVADRVNSLLYVMDSTEQFDGTNIFVRLERHGLPLVGRDFQGQFKVDLDTEKFIRRFTPKIKANASVSFYIGGQHILGGPIEWQGPFAFDPATDRHIDLRLTTRFICIRLESTTAGRWEFSGYTLDLDVLGEAPRG